MTTVVLAWGAALGMSLAAALFGQTARGGGARRRRSRSGAHRLGLALSMSGPWLALLGAVAGGAMTGAWLAAAAVAAVGTATVATAGLVLVPR